MSVDAATVTKVAHLARIAVTEDETARLTGELNAILGFVEELSAIDVEGVEPMTSVVAMTLRTRPDVVTAGENVKAVLANAPATEDGYFLVPKVVE